MNREQDFAQFRRLLDQLCATWDRPPAKDELVEAYWEALRFDSLTEIERNARRIMKTAGRRTPWPKPGELRDESREETPQRAASQEAARRGAEVLNAETWKQLEAQDPVRHEIEIGIARCARIMVSSHESTPQFAEARQLDWELRQRRRALQSERAQGNGV